MESAATAVLCPGCDTQLGPDLLVCPACHRLVHQDRLKELAAVAQAAERSGDLTAELTAWREARELLPAGSRQFELISEKMTRLRERIDAGEHLRPAAPAGAGGGGGRKAGALGALSLLVWKFKFAAFLVLGKLKLLMAGLASLPTLLSMFVWLQVDWQNFGWHLALGVMICIYVHEMGHVAAISRYGMKASAPMFIPGFGALVRLSTRPADPVENARIGLAGPMWGFGAAVIAWLAGLAFSQPLLVAVGGVSAWINLFNLVPVWQLDGARGFAALSRAQRLGVVAACALTRLFSTEKMSVMIAVCALFQLFLEKPPERGAARPFAEFVFLILALSALCQATDAASVLTQR